jgi:serine/threonine protein kinase
MLTATVPFKQKLMMEQEQIHFPQRLSRAVKDFISRLLIFHPKRRMTVEEALQHPWLVQEEHSGDESLPTSEIQMLDLNSYSE